MPEHKSTKWKLISIALLTVLLLPQIGLAQQRDMASRMASMWPDFPDWPPKVGETAIDFTLKTLEGEEFTLSKYYANGPVVIEFGSFT